ENSSIHYSNNKGSSWQVSNLSGNGIGVIGKIRADRNTTDDVFICTDQEVFSVQDHGASISNITYNLPQITIQAFEIDENNNLYVATTSAVYFLQDGGQYWHELGSDLPFIPVNILRIDNGREKLYVCTDGRGVWSIDLPECSKTDNVNNCSFSLSPNPAVNQFTVKDFKNSSNVITKIENIRIYNMSNDLVYQKNISDYSYTFKNIPFLSRNQYYIIELIDENGQGCTKQFLKN
ncbi:MAG: hypothetical protein MRY83_25110, partial [Flavobacteriales bacterium]|nr:hypothetical protein [Flavobacteriales bacterium]